MFVPLDHSTPVEPPSQQAATIADTDTDMNETVSRHRHNRNRLLKVTSNCVRKKGFCCVPFK